MTALRAALLLIVLTGCGAAAVETAPAKTAAKTDVAPACPSDVPEQKGDPEAAEASFGAKVVRVCVFGADGDARAAADKAILTKAGDQLTADRVREDLRAAIASGAFDDGAAWAQRAGDGVVLSFALHERPRVASIAFEGAKVFGNDALASKVPFDRNARFDPAKMTAAARALEDEYRSRGYLVAGVRWHGAETEPGKVAVKVNVFEGPLHRFAKIVFKGNKKIAEAELAKIAELSKGEPYTRDKVSRAALSVQAAYYDRGMVEAKVDVERDEASDAAGVTFVVDEGSVFTVGKVAFGKDGKTLEKDLLAQLKTKPGQTFSRKGMLEDLERVSRALGEKNLHGELSPTTEIDAKKKTIDVTINVTFRQ